ncbi:ribonuclease III [Daedalea quercina L-15889]|uniref:Ribonuclease III n=1 Tax=Daedalea quercina L-15889 TaxID=1314783 RepID=A0A165S554_9APHY|nr:ribonuclease III [Daedalea quercina L-15889]
MESFVLPPPATVMLVSGRKALMPNISPEALPPLPEIQSEEIRLQVYTHRSYAARPTHRFEDLPDDPSPDNEKYEHLGDSVLSMVVTELINDIYPYIRVGPSTKIRSLVVGNPTLASISVHYGLPEDLRMHPAQAITLRHSQNVQADLFEAFVGGLYLDQGLDAVKSWLCPLFHPYVVEGYGQVRIQHCLPPESDLPPVFPTLNAALPMSSRYAANMGHLSLFNQHLQQQAKSIEWVFSDSVGQGTRTTPIWVVRAMVDERCIGSGRGSTKKAAKNEAAKEGLRNMGIIVSLFRPPLRMPPLRLSRIVRTIGRLGRR